MRLWACIEEPVYQRRGPLWGRLKWARKPLSVVDLLALLPFWFDLRDSNTTGIGSTGSFMRSARLMRLFSILRVERQTKGLRRLQVGSGEH